MEFSLFVALNLFFKGTVREMVFLLPKGISANVFKWGIYNLVERSRGAKIYKVCQLGHLYQPQCLKANSHSRLGHTEKLSKLFKVFAKVYGH